MDLFGYIVGAILVILAVPLLQRYWKWYQISVIVNKIPGPRTFPLIGTVWQAFGVARDDIFSLIIKNTKDYPNIYRAWFGIYPEVHLSKAEYVGQILGVSKHLDKHYIYDYIRPWLGDGLLVGSGEKWHRNRRLINPAFHISILSAFCEVFAEQSEILVRKLEEATRKKDIPVDVCPFVAKAALDIISETAMGTKIKSQDKDEIEYVNAIHDIIQLSFNRAFSPWLNTESIYKMTGAGKKFYDKLTITHDFTMNVIQERKKTRADEKLLNIENLEETKRRQAFLDLLLEVNEHNSDMSMEDVLAEVNTFMFAGHDTTSTALSFTLFAIGHYQSIQEEIVEELNSIFGDSERPANYQDLNEMKYLERVIKESLRLYPPVPFIGRLSSEDVEIQGYLIPKQTYINVELYHILRDPEHFPEPEKFDPDRHLTDNTTDRHQYAYIPFSAGPRNCIGQKFAILEMKSVITSILRKFKIRSADTPSDIRLMMEIVLRSRNGIKLYLEKRNQLI